MKYTLLYVEDDRKLAELNIEYFMENGFSVTYAENGEVALQKYERCAPDIILLDIIMAGKYNGLDVAKEIRQKDTHTPILFLSSLSQSADVVKGLNLGANDYIRKDVDREEILTRLQVTLRNYSKPQSEISITPDTVLHVNNRSVTCCGETVQMSFRQCDLLRFLASHVNELHTRDMITDTIWGGNLLSDTYLSKSLSFLRRVLSKDKAIEIVSQRGNGVIFSVKGCEWPDPRNRVYGCSTAPKGMKHF